MTDLNALQLDALLALRRLGEKGRARSWPSSSEVAGEMDDPPRVRRHGSGAVKGSWSGYMDPGMQVSHTLRALERRGLVMSTWDPRENRASRYVWMTTKAGREVDPRKVNAAARARQACRGAVT